MVPADDVFTFFATEDPSLDSDCYAGVKDLEEGWVSETTTVDVVVHAATLNLLADVEVRFGGDVEDQGRMSDYIFSEIEPTDVATDTEEI